MSTVYYCCLTLTLILCFGCASVEHKGSLQPNVVFVLVDDLGWTDLGCYGSTFYDTPNLDKLAANSMRFTNAYAASPVCSPTRAAIMTGKNPARLHITDWIPGRPPAKADHPLLETPQDLHNLPQSETTLAESFREAGYQTFFAGKWHLGETEASWPLAHGFEINKGGCDWGSPRAKGGGGYYSPYHNSQLGDGPDGEYLTDRLTDESIKFVEENGGQPFFLYLAYYTVHSPIEGCKAYDAQYEEKRKLLPDSGAIVTAAEHNGITRINQSDAKYAAMVRSLDANIGRLIEALETKDMLEQTVIIFTSDNGGLSTLRRPGPTSVRPLRAGKGWCYEGGIRVPLLIKYPGMTDRGKVSNALVTSMDYYPTLLELCKMSPKIDQHMDGESLVPLWSHKASQEDRVLMWHYPHYHGSTWRPGSALRKGDWKLVKYYENRVSELYNLANDIGERNDLSDSLPEVKEQLNHELEAMLTGMNAQMPRPL